MMTNPDPAVLTPKQTMGNDPYSDDTKVQFWQWRNVPGTWLGVYDHELPPEKVEIGWTQRALHFHPATRESLIAALAEVAPELMVCKWRRKALDNRHKFGSKWPDAGKQKLVYRTASLYIDGLRPPSQPAKE